MNRQEALTSEQVKPIRMSTMRHVGLAGLVFLAALVVGCSAPPRRAAELRGPYVDRQLFAVVPLRNESGSAYADGVRLADRLNEQLTLTAQIDTVPVNRVLAAMDRLGLSEVTTKSQALALRQTLGVDGLLVGSITTYDPYDPPKLGINVELYLNPRHESAAFDIRKLSRAATDHGFRLEGYTAHDQPVTALSTFFDAAHPSVQDRMAYYARHRGTDYGQTSADARLYRISTDLYTDFVAYEVCARLMHAETRRIIRPASSLDGATPDPQMAQH